MENGSNTWQEQSACAGMTARFYSEDKVQIESAKRICFSCPVSSECLKFALKNEEDFGVWGGYTRKERRRIIRQERRIREKSGV
jgi:WhiB family redox-sensing transcriptional regulator